MRLDHILRRDFSARIPSVFAGFMPRRPCSVRPTSSPPFRSRNTHGVSSSVMNPQAQPPRPASLRFRVLRLAGALSPLGIDFQAAVNVNRFMNVRGVGNVFNYSLNNISVSGFNVNGKVNLASAGLSLDVFPWPQSRIPHQPRRAVL